MRAAIYLRQSLDLHGDELGVSRQRDACMQVCRTRGWGTTEYVDNSVSASKERGPGSAYARLLTDARAGRIGAVVVWDLDRLTRRPREVEDWLDLCERQRSVRLITTDGEVDTASPNGRMYLRIKAAVARHEVEHKARRQRAANAQRAAEGAPPAGRDAFGWGSPAAGDAVREAARLVLAGGSLRSVARLWNGQGHTTSHGGPWRARSVRDVLVNPRIAGLRVYGEHTYRGTWEPLVDETTWRAVVALLNDPARRTYDQAGRLYLLPGLATCGLCGAKIISGGRARHGSPARLTYRCSASAHLCRAMDPVDEYVTAVVLERLSRPDARDLLVADDRPDAGELHERALTLRSRLDGLAELVADGTLSPASARRAAGTLREELERVEVLMTDAGRVDVLGPLVGAPDVREVWEGLDVDRRQLVIRTLRMAVTVHPPGRGARSFDPETVVIEWT